MSRGYTSGWHWTRPHVGRPLCIGKKCRTIAALNGVIADLECADHPPSTCYICGRDQKLDIKGCK